jgi:SAM-dependent methyltransferase
MNAAQAWREQLAGWAIPEHITAAVADSPWTLPTGTFTRRAQRSVARPGGVSYERAAHALPGEVLDVGAGAGSASLPLAPLATRITAVDASGAMLAEFARLAEGTGGASIRTVLGSWPDVAALVEPADVVVCHHVAYNVPDLAAFALALHEHARRRVVLELTALHPFSSLNPLWTQLHGLARPTGPTAEDAAAVLREAGLVPVLEAWPRPPRPEHPSFAELVATTRRRLCLPPERTDDLVRVLLELGVDPKHPLDLPVADDRVVTLWWDV